MKHELSSLILQFWLHYLDLGSMVDVIYFGEPRVLLNSNTNNKKGVFTSQSLLSKNGRLIIHFTFTFSINFVLFQSS